MKSILFTLSIAILPSILLAQEPPAGFGEEVFTKVEEDPRYIDPECEALEATPAEKKKCADKKLVEFVQSNVKYPKIAREVGIQGTVIIKFVIDTSGNVTNAEVLREPGGGLGAEALGFVKALPPFIPGRQRGKKVKVVFNLPVRFKLMGNGDKTVRYEKVMPKAQSNYNGPKWPTCTETDYRMAKSCSQQAFIDFLAANLVYPTNAPDPKLAGNITVAFKLNSNGTPHRFEVLHNKLGKAYEEEAIRVIKLMPKLEGSTDETHIVVIAFNP